MGSPVIIHLIMMQSVKEEAEGRERGGGGGGETNEAGFPRNR